MAPFVEMEKAGRGSFFWERSWSSLWTMLNLRGQLDTMGELLDKLSNRVFKRRRFPIRIGVMENILKEVGLN